MFRAALLAASLFSLPALAQDKLDVVATFSIIGDFAREIGGDRIDLTVLVGPDGNAHAFEPRPQDAAALSKADVILANGANFEGFLPRLVKASGAAAPVTDLTSGITLIRIDADHEGHDGHAAEHDGHQEGGVDPHAFQSASNAVIYVENAANALCAADKAGCDAYRANAKAYIGKLLDLDFELHSAIAAVAPARRSVITSHDAFRYFGNAYGIAFHAAEGVSTDAAPSAAEIARLIDQAREDAAAAIFVENISNPKLAAQIADETGLALGGTLYSDALTGPDGPAPTYLDLMRHNMQTIVKALSAG